MDFLATCQLFSARCNFRTAVWALSVRFDVLLETIQIVLMTFLFSQYTDVFSALEVFTWTRYINLHLTFDIWRFFSDSQLHWYSVYLQWCRLFVVGELQSRHFAESDLVFVKVSTPAAALHQLSTLSCKPSVGLRQLRVVACRPIFKKIDGPARWQARCQPAQVDTINCKRLNDESTFRQIMYTRIAWIAFLFVYFLKISVKHEKGSLSLGEGNLMYFTK